jgi:hypothetical protein
MAQRKLWFPKNCTDEQRRSKEGPLRPPEVPASAVWVHEQYHEDPGDGPRRLLARAGAMELRNSGARVARFRTSNARIMSDGDFVRNATPLELCYGADLM